MPNKTIYVPDDLISVFEHAQELTGGNLSAAIAAALQQYVADRSLQRRRFTRVVVTVGTTGVLQEKRFHGLLVARWDDRDRYYLVYFTPRDNFALEVRGRSIAAGRSVARFPQCPGAGSGRSAEDDLLRDASAHRASPLGLPVGPPGPAEALPCEFGTFLYVYDQFESFQSDVPETLARITHQSLNEPLTEDLDI